MTKMKALVTQGEGKVSVQEIDVPKPAEGEILVQVTYVAQNPTDWKAAGFAKPGMISGCDFAGKVAEPNGSSWKKGQRVAGFVQGSSKNGLGEDPLRGVFAEYCVIESSLVYSIPDDISDQQAAVIPLAFATAVQGLFQRLALPEPSKPATSAFPLLVSGGATSVGKYAIQLGKLAGLFVVATGSKRNHELLKSLGADETVDYNDKDWPEQVHKITHDGLEHAFDCIAEKGTYEGCAAAMSSTKGGHVVGLLPPGKSRDEVAKIHSKVKLESTIVYTVFARALNYPMDNCGGETPQDKAIWEKYLGLLPELLSSGKVKPNRIREVGGLDDIPTGFQEQKEGKVSAEKLVYKISGASGKL
ncbi:GroES-like protein [Cryphonectria parasitica EP155]|uniref:GroES-like protein n=1 Tax=Cryphonectria parasitica (strain ATCC 38755 / EP155) TaxID=660469 RepID=A0A9P5CRJ2_CRYP1|nr:GroES-like protein [Cryphonectria parasitica EP155]KAF3767331.1 GroES-like protein [Cryphonectria parasitica EP155]